MSTRRRARRTGNGRRRALVLLGLAVAFLAGIGLGEALNDGPDPGGGQTIVRTLLPGPLPPVSAETGTAPPANR